MVPAEFRKLKVIQRQAAASLTYRSFAVAAAAIFLSIVSSCSSGSSVSAQVSELIEGDPVAVTVSDLVCSGRSGEFASLSDLKSTAVAELHMAGLDPPFVVQPLRGSDTEFWWRVGGKSPDPYRDTVLVSARRVDGKICNNGTRLVFNKARIEQRVGRLPG